MNMHTCFSIWPRPPSISVCVDHSNPALVGEYYSATLSVVNQEATPITGIEVKISLPDCLDEAQPQGQLRVLYIHTHRVVTCCTAH